ncbi:hypothetical protein [Azoarcus sp. KH32C]|uniref:hypothetical protein n=1 Tax=Azoarcus sp. KH32C TaxID=748247 RepID=UPI00059FA541|nr:hypothetical protein [Azoarcus sp. KH32C]
MRKSAIAAAFVLVPLIPIAASGHLNPFLTEARSAVHPPGHFGAQLVLTPNEQRFAEALISEPRLPEALAVDSVRRGSSVAAVLIFQGCATDRSGKCDVVADFSVISPSGREMSGGSGALWSDAPVPGGLHLGNASIGLSFGDDDPVGRYHVIATVTDKVSGRQLMFDTPLTLSE